MLLFRRSWLEAHLRLRFLRGLSRIFLSEHSSEARGLRLLRSWLSPEQRAQFDDYEPLRDPKAPSLSAGSVTVSTMAL